MLISYYICKYLYHFVFLQGSDNFICDTCQNQYAAKSSLLRHQKMEHGTEQFHCEHCGKKMSRSDSKKRHERSCEGDTAHICPKCNKRCATAQGLKRHLQWHDKTQNQTSLSTAKAAKPISPKACPVQTTTPAQATQYRCRRCTHVFAIGMTCICMVGGNTTTSTAEPCSLDHGVAMMSHLWITTAL